MFELQENVLGADWRNSKGAGSFGVGNSRQPSRKQVQEPTNMVDSKSSSGESGKMSVDKFSTTDSPSVPSTSRALDVRPSTHYEFMTMHTPNMLLK